MRAADTPAHTDSHSESDFPVAYTVRTAGIVICALFAGMLVGMLANPTQGANRFLAAEHPPVPAVTGTASSAVEPR